MPRRTGWLRDYHQEYDYGTRRVIDPTLDDEPSSPPSQASPVTINININLGDLINKVMKGKSAHEALEEALEECETKKRHGRRRLDE